MTMISSDAHRSLVALLLCVQGSDAFVMASSSKAIKSLQAIPTFVLESDMFPDSHASLRKSIEDGGYEIVDWDDEWWSEGFPKKIKSKKDGIFFHGSLGNAAKICSDLEWTPGSFCDESKFRCSAWYDSARELLLHKDWRFIAAKDLVETATQVAADLNCQDRVFVRPDSPLKPFSGRVLHVDKISLRALDHGFYYDDETLSVVVCPVAHVGREWRFIVSDAQIVAGSAYDAETRSALPETPDSDAWNFAAAVAKDIPPPDKMFILDVCETDGGELRLLELNPFGGADLYACDANAIVQALANLA